MDQLEVLVIGAGPAGLCAARHLSSNKRFRFKVLEKTGSIGGVWAYTDNATEDEYGVPVHSSLYRDLRTDIPAEIMSFMHFPFPVCEESYLHHTKVMEYLNSYVEHFNLLEYIEFHREVKNVSPVTNGHPMKWKVCVNDVTTKTITEHIFDAVMICNGHLSQPRIPDIPGIETFKGRVIHSHAYRTSEPFKGKNVLIWGASLSAFDISQEVAVVAKSVVVSHRPTQWMPKGFPEEIKFAANVHSACENGFVLEDGSKCEADAFIYCTGYLFSFPFLSPGCGIEVHDNHVTPLYKHMVNVEYQTMSIVGVPYQTIPFITFDYQVQFFLKTLDNTVKLPSKEQMKRESESYLMNKIDQNIPLSHAHHLGVHQWEYFEDLAEYADLERLPSVVKNVMHDSVTAMFANINDFKNYKYKILDDKDFRKDKIKDK